MPNNRKQREQAIREKYDFVCFGNEYSIFNAALAAVDLIVTGGNFTFQYLQHEVQQFGISLSMEMASAGLDPAHESLRFDKMIFENWETPLPHVKIPFPNKFVPYVAARPKSIGPVVFPEAGPYEGYRITKEAGPGAGAVYLVLDGTRCHIPNRTTYDNLFVSWPAGIHNVLDIESIPAGPPLSDGALLAAPEHGSKVFLISNGLKRHVRDPAVMNRFGFDASLVKDLPVTVLDHIPAGPDII